MVPIPLDLAEMGLPEDMTAQVLANEPCPSISMAPGRVVLTTVSHLNSRVVELTLSAPDGTRETVRPTAFHKFYSQSRNDWLSAEDLQPGELLRGLDGPLQVVSVHPVPGTHRVYNMTVEGEHVYHVSTLAVLAHNDNCRPGFRLGDPITKALPDGSYPKWFAKEAREKANTIQGRYWMNRAAAAAPGEFTVRQLADMRAGFAPRVKIIVLDAEGNIGTKTVSKELHHNLRNRGIPGFDDPLHLREVWPWEHALIDDFRFTEYEFLGILD